MDPFKLLEADHRNVEKLFTQLESAQGAAKLRVFEQIRTELELHTHIEEKIFYPALEKPEETHDLTLEAYEEHAVVKDLLKQLGRAKTANDEWEAQAKVLKENVEHHVQEEENELFQKAEDALNQEDLEALGERMQAEKARRQQSGAASKGSKASKASKGSKSAGTKKSASKSTAGSKAAKRAGGTKKSGGSKKSASGSKKSSKKGSKSSASKSTKGSGTKKSAAKKR
jgi:hemerythrin-like domain-containing protein